MALGDYLILPGLVTEEIGQEILVCDTDLAVVHRVSGPAADVLRQVLANRGAPAALESDDITSGLVAAGVLIAADAPGDLVSRRSFVSAAAAVGAIGIVTLALPRAAAASSGDGTSGFVALDPFVESTGSEGSFSVLVDVLPSGSDVDIRWRTAAGAAPFSYDYRITSNGTLLASGTLTSSESLTRVLTQTNADSVTIEVVSEFGARIIRTQQT
jgi:hypothetical protein